MKIETVPASVHVLSLAPRLCPACDVPAPLVERGFETCLGTLGPHDPNCVEGVFVCPAGHRFTAATQYVCACGWSGVKVCMIGWHDQRWPLP